MKKTLLATAIAGALGTMAAGAQAATVYNQDGSKLDVYGNVQIGWQNTKDSSGESTDELFDNGSTIGFRGEHIINPDLTGYFRAEFEFNADRQKGYYGAYNDDGDLEGTRSGLSRGDQAYLGLTGNFGDLRIGSWDNLIDDWVQDPVSNNEYFDNTDSSGDIGGSTWQEANKITYTSPVTGGFQFAIGTRYYGDAEDTNDFLDAYANGTTVRNDDGTVADPATQNGDFVVDDGGSASLFGGLRYMVGDWTLAAVYDDLKNFKYVEVGGDEHDYGQQFGLNATWQMNDDLRVSAKWEQLHGQWADDADANRYGIGARYSYGVGDIYGSYQYVDADRNAVALVDPGAFNGVDQGDDESYNEFILGATYNLSSQMYIWLEGAKYDREAHEGDGVATGIAYSF
ncbi:Outer membrane protein (porin) [Kushneria avicenniae]|uniref:Outer membrane protein (Porin) n=1 Tax=Kushneria avicenniae TaxID=402385 RepID=A0A1I1ICY5_9GAMM|nr:porin [Kushneria avicenniae]SFC33532.1 Outer membrane protein (porin) [Kushneria avicenniae]